MNKYGRTALRAADLAMNKALSPLEAWQKIAAEEFAGLPEAMNKSCPREAFLGLCDAGMLNGITSQNITHPDSPNKNYATTAVELLIEDPSIAEQGKSTLWEKVLENLGTTITHNQQMDVVLSLWDEGYIKGSPIQR